LIVEAGTPLCRDSAPIRIQAARASASPARGFDDDGFGDDGFGDDGFGDDGFGDDGFGDDGFDDDGFDDDGFLRVAMVVDVAGPRRFGKWRVLPPTQRGSRR
jgi:hypothetical protein